MSETAFLLDFWERMISESNDEAPTIARVIASFRNHYEQHGGWPEKIKLTDPVIDALDCEIEIFASDWDWRTLWVRIPRVGGDSGVTLFGVPCEVVGRTEPPKPRGILEVLEP